MNERTAGSQTSGRAAGLAAMALSCLMAVGFVASTRAEGTLPVRPATSPAQDKPEGFGASSQGGAGGRVILVTSLADSGAGTLREALGQAGPRIIRFGVEGTIALQSRLRCTEGRVTIDGSTSPGKGITLLDHGLGFVSCSDIIVRHLRIRVTTGGASGDGILLWGKDGRKVQRALVDHCSVMGATDEVINTWGEVEEATFQWCIVAEGRRPHSKAWLSGQGSDHITIHHCLLSNCDDRNPKLEGGLYDLSNNVISGWANNNGTKVRLGARVNIVNNIYLAGPASSPLKGCIFIEDPPKDVKLFVAGNVSALTPGGEAAWSIVTLNQQVNGRWVERRPAPDAYRADKAFETPAVTTQPALNACELILAGAGAGMRDDADERVIAEIRDRLGKSTPKPAGH